MIDANRIPAIFTDCLFRDDEVVLEQGNGVTGGKVPESGVPAQGIMTNVIFNGERLEQHRAELTGYLLQLPVQFLKSGGGGWSFLEACADNTGEQWTGLHQTMDQLLTLGQALGIVKCLLPREVWNALPGGMPYYMVVDDAVSAPAG